MPRQFASAQREQKPDGSQKAPAIRIIPPRGSPGLTQHTTDEPPIGIVPHTGTHVEFIRRAALGSVPAGSSPADVVDTGATYHATRRTQPQKPTGCASASTSDARERARLQRVGLIEHFATRIAVKRTTSRHGSDRITSPIVPAVTSSTSARRPAASGNGSRQQVNAGAHRDREHNRLPRTTAGHR